MAAPPAVSAEARQRALDAYRKLPLAFVPNQGQSDPGVRYVAQGAGYGFYFTAHKLVLSLSKPSPGAWRQHLIAPPRSLEGPFGSGGERESGVALELRFPGASSEARLEAHGKALGNVNYLADAEHHRQRGLPSFAELTYRGLWPGIDLRFRGEQGKLKYEFHLAPGADPRRIRLAYAGAAGLSLTTGGSLAVETRLGTLEDTRPRSYQRVGGRRVPVMSRYTLGRKARNDYGFALGSYDRGQPLVIDPGLAYSSFLGGMAFNTGSGIAVDGRGNAYLTGTTLTLEDFPTTPGAFDTTINGELDAFVTKLNAAGSALAYSTFLGGTSNDSGSAIAVDRRGNAYLTGSTDSANFPTTAGAFDTTRDLQFDAFVTKLDAAGSAILYSTFLGGPSPDSGSGIALDGKGNAYVTGFTDSANFPTTAGAFDSSFNGDGDAFVTKLNAAGSALRYSSYLGGTSLDFGAGIAVDHRDNAYVTGGTESGSFPTTPGTFDESLDGDEDAFVTKLNAAGSALRYSSYLGGTSNDGGSAIAVDQRGNAHLTGTTFSVDFPTTPRAIDTILIDDRDAFLTELNAAGSALAYSTFLGGTSGESGLAIALDGRGNAYLTGETFSADFPTTAGAFDTTLDGDGDAFVAKLDAAGPALAYASYLGGTSFDRGSGIALDGRGNAYLTGETFSADFPTTAGAFDTTYNGGIRDAFITKLATR